MADELGPAKTLTIPQILAEEIRLLHEANLREHMRIGECDYDGVRQNARTIALLTEQHNSCARDLQTAQDVIRAFQD